MNGRSVPESTRERETFKYDPTLLTDIIYNDNGKPLDNTRLRTSHDPVLTSIASLGASRLKTAASLVSLFDQKWQYIIAEATPTLSLAPRATLQERDGEPLWLCGTAIPRVDGVCEHTLVSQNPKDFEEVGQETDLPLTRVTDLGEDPRHCYKPWCLPGSPARFYAAVPIRSRRGINIGVYCVIDTVPRTDWPENGTRTMRELSRTIMEYLELRRSKHEFRRGERMTRGLGSFVDGKATTAGALEDDQGVEGALNANQSSIQRQKDEAAERHTSPESPLERRHRVGDASGQGVQDPTTVRTMNYRAGTERGSIVVDSSAVPSNDQHTVNDIFSKAANIIRESIEIEGALFLDASLRSFGGLTRPLGTDGMSGLGSASPSDSDGGKSAESSTEAAEPCCSVLGFSTSQSSSIDGAETVAHHANVSEKLLSALLRRYPTGKIFSFDVHGALETSDSSDAELEPSQHMPQVIPPLPRLHNKRTKGNPWDRHMEGAAISAIFPGARSVAFVPVWDAKKDRWYAGCLAFTCNPTRTFSTAGELSYLRAFGMLTTSASALAEANMANKAKSDVLSSLSHELRSPLHGVVLGVELLHDTKLDVFQGDVLHTLETCGRTLLDTVDHLLDFAKINNYMASEKERKRGIRSLSRTDRRNTSIEDGMKSLVSDVRLDVLTEEVMESVFAGSNFQHLSVAQIARRDRWHTDRESNQRLDSMQAMEELGTEQMQLQPRNVSVYLEVDPNCAWTFSVTPGAIRRILMNLFGNSLKYTHEGTIKVSLAQEVTFKKARGRQRVVKITVADTGQGIGEDFLRNELFRPFSQEDTLAPGTGLGLSLVKQIVSSLGGNISVKSGIGLGTKVSITLPLSPVAPLSASSAAAVTQEDKDFDSQVEQLRGLRIRLVGFKRPTTKPEQTSKQQELDGYALMERTCQDWLGMQVLAEDYNQDELTPDLVLCAEASLDNLESNRPPTVVVCANTLVAYHRITSAKSFGIPGTLEFISQPTGPRKLAKTLVHSYNRWVEGQALSPNETSSVSSFDPLSGEAFPIRPGLMRSHTTPGSRRGSQMSVTREPEVPTAAVQPLGTDDGNQPSPKQADRPALHRVGSSTETIVEENPSPLPPPPPVDEVEFLLVDDNAINLKILSSYMKKLGRKYNTANNGQEAFDIYREAPSRYRCVFMDISMPVMDGFEATRQIRALEREQRLQPASIFALSGLASADAQQEAFASGIDLFLTKPVKLNEINSILTTRGFL